MVVQAMKNRMMKKQAKQTNKHTYIQAKQIVTGTRLDDQGQSWSQSSKSMTWNAYLLECKRLKPNGKQIWQTWTCKHKYQSCTKSGEIRNSPQLKHLQENKQNKNE